MFVASHLSAIFLAICQPVQEGFVREFHLASEDSLHLCRVSLEAYSGNSHDTFVVRGRLWELNLFRSLPSVLRANKT